MNLQLDYHFMDCYKNNPQKMRKVTESWITENLICPYCRTSHLIQSTQEHQSTAFICPTCAETYVLKSKNSPIHDKIQIGAYQVMAQSIISLKNPNFLFLEYDKKEFQIQNLFMVPRYFFCTDTIERRSPISSSTRRRGWVGCNILLNRIPAEGYIYIVENGIEYTIQEIWKKQRRTYFMSKYKPRAREWMIDILNFIQEKEFTVEEICAYAPLMEIRYVGIVDAEVRIRKVLGILKKNGVIVFAGNGKYVRAQN